jgi:hypothetical protein
MQLTPHFTLAELCNSDTATRLGIDNDPRNQVLNSARIDPVEALRETAKMLEGIRHFLSGEAGTEIPIRISSGYRCLALNRVLGSKDNSEHLTGFAVDWTAPDFGSPYEVALALRGAMAFLGIGQLIHEYGRWIHTSVEREGKIFAEHNRVITISAVGTYIGVHPV